MITRFFSTSKPIHLIIVAILTFVLFVYARFGVFEDGFEWSLAAKELGVYLVLFISIAILAFYVTKNNLTQRNSYKILFYVLFLAALPATLQFDNIILANLFVLLAMRRIMSLRTNLRIKKKLFDAAFWIGIASLFYFWSILFFALILAALLLFSMEQLKNWVIPFLGLLTVAILVICYAIITQDTFGDISQYIEATNYDFSQYNDMAFILPGTILISLGLWALFFYLKSLDDKPKVFRVVHVLVIISAILSMAIIAVTPNKNGSEFIFLFAPLAVIMSNYLQLVKESWFAELYVWLLILTPVAVLLL